MKKLLVVDYSNEFSLVEYFDEKEPCETCGKVGSFKVDEDPGIGLCPDCIVKSYDEIYEIDGDATIHVDGKENVK